jgi:hypothetical protein
LPKLPSVLAFAAVSSMLLVGCTTTPAGEPADPTTTAAESASPSATATPKETEMAEPEESVTPEPTPETPAPTSEPAPAASDEPFVPPPHGEPAPVDPFVPPPHGEPAPGTPFVPPPHGEPNPFAGLNPVIPDPVAGTVQIVAQAGTSFTVMGSGYQPGQRIVVFFGPSNTDFSIIGDQSAYADASGNYSFPITLSPAIAPGSYGVMTATPDGLSSGPEIDATRRWATVEVVAP